MYKQLQNILNKCIEKWWKPRWKQDISLIKLTKKFIVLLIITVRWKVQDNYWIHDLFSKDSWLLEQFEWNVKGDTNIFYSSLKPLWRVKRSDCIYMVMWPMTAEEKVKYFIDNVTI